jgi:hypothetical protein
MDLEVACDNGFTELGKKYIERTIDIFKNFEFARESEDWQWLKIDGKVFGPDTEPYNYWIHYIKDGFSVQLCSKKDLGQTSYMFGIVFYVENNEKKAYVYHHGHGPFFSIFECEYERVN